MKVSDIKPLADYVLIEPKEMETKLPSGIVLSDTTKKDKPQEGKILATGPGKKDDKGNTIELTVKSGQTVMYKKWAGTEVKVENKEYLLAKEEDILAIIEG